jgi:branched-chain amino acid transport system ATP-binding protein
LSLRPEPGPLVVASASTRIVDQIAEIMARINREGVAILFIEQHVERALALAHRGFVLESGRTVLQGRSAELLRSPEVRKVFLGG